eukprot:jgi/Ulvmu1/11710/UM008_0121.1
MGPRAVSDNPVLHERVSRHWIRCRRDVCNVAQGQESIPWGPTVSVRCVPLAMARKCLHHMRSCTLDCTHESLLLAMSLLPCHPELNCSNLERNQAGVHRYWTRYLRMQKCMNSGQQLQSGRLGKAKGRGVRVGAVQQSASFLGNCPAKAQSTLQAIREAVAHSTCGPYAELASEDTLIINPPWAREPRTTGISHAECGIVTDTSYAEEYVNPIAASYADDGSLFLLWERKAEFSRGSTKHTEDICGVTYIKMSDGNASVIATFRQPSPEELASCFSKNCTLQVRPGADNFFHGAAKPRAPPGSARAMMASARAFYDAWELGAAEAGLESIASPKLRMFDPVWEEAGAFQPVNRVEAAMWLERKVKQCGGRLSIEPKAVSHVEDSNMVFVLWFASGPHQPEFAGVHIFFFGDDHKIESVAAFREAFEMERKTQLL